MKTSMEKAEDLNIFSPQFSLVITLHTSVKSLNIKAETEGMKSLSL